MIPIPIEYILAGILVTILVVPLTFRQVEERLEVFFLVMGLIAAAISGKLGIDLLIKAAEEPIMIHGIPIGIVQVVLLAGLAFYYLRERVVSAINAVAARIGPEKLVAILALMLGLGSSVVSAIVGSVILAEILRVLKLSHRAKIYAGILGAYSIGIGAALLPIGEPLSTIAISKLGEDPLYLLRLLSPIVIPLVILFSALSFIIVKRVERIEKLEAETVAKSIHVQPTIDVVEPEPGLMEVVIRAVKVYAFIAALVMLGESMEPLVDAWFKHLPPWALYILGAISSAVDNATLTAAIVSPELVEAYGHSAIRSFLSSLLVSGGFLIPGNVPNIVIASVIGIRFVEWARIAVPIGAPIFIALAPIVLLLP